MKQRQKGIRHAPIQWVAVAIILLLIAVSTVSATAEPLSQNRHIFFTVANDAGVKYDFDGSAYGTEGNNNTYYIKADGGGLNELHITADPSAPSGQVTTSEDQSGTFYISNTGGRGFDDTVVLLLAVNGTVPDDFAVHIKTSGYNWTVSNVTNQAPTDYAYVEGAVDETFTKEDFIYGPQTWKPGPGAIGPVGLPLYEYQDVGDTSNTFSLMFIDLYAGNLKPSNYPDLADEGQGAVKVEYSFENLETFAAFNAYGWCLAANQAQGISWTNRVNAAGETAIGTSSYAVIGVLPAPTADFTATPLSGDAPLEVAFTDMSADDPTSWAWDFENDGVVDSTEQNPTFTYTTAGTYTVNLTVANAGGSNSVVMTDYIAVTEPAGPSGPAPLPAPRHIFFKVANDAGVKYNLDGTANGGPNGTYYIKADGGGLNELHITNSVDAPYGQVFEDGNQSGTLWITNTGGRGFDDDVILLVSVNGTIPDDFALHIKTSGYNWTPTGVTPTDYTYVEGAVDETFTKEDFIYGPQTWKPGPGDLVVPSLPFYYGQDINDKTTESYLMFIDLNVGNIKNTSMIDGGGAKVEFTFTNLTTHAAFNAYGWCLAANQGQGISWTNRVSGVGSSGYTVTGVPAAPTADFTAAPLSGAAPLAVDFIDTSVNAPVSWAWDFENDGVVDSTEQNPTHTYASGGNYTVNLTVTNPQGSNSMVKTDYIRVGDRVSKTWTVGSSGCDFTTLNDAFTNSFLEDGDTIFVYNGSYTLTASTTKVLTILGEGADVVTVNPTSATISGAGTVVEGMTFSSGGLITFGSANGIIRNCTFQGMTGGAILSGAGIVFEENTVRNNTINQPIDVTGNDCLITNNTFAYNGQLPSGTQIPIRLNGCSGVIVAWNDFTGNTGGIGLRASGAGNAIYLNNFAGYNVAVRSSGGATPQAITWNAPAVIDYTYNGVSHSGLLGNYWSTYTGTDANGDGVGDTAYSLPVTGQTDNYPLTDRTRYYFGADHVIASIGIAPASATMNVTDTLQLAATAYEADGYPAPGIAFTWSSSNETVGTVDGTGLFTALAPGTTEVAAVNGSLTGTSTVTVLVPSITAAFTASPLAGEVPLTVQFTDTTDGTGISAWAWDFENDGVVDSTEQNPTYTYASVENYSVNLTVTGLAGTDSLVRENYISALDRQAVIGWGILKNLVGPDIRAIGAGYNTGYGIRNDGSLVRWGGWNVLPEGNDFVQVVGSESGPCAALRANGTIVTFGSTYLAPPAGDDFVAIAQGKAFGVALRANGTLATWGDANSGNTNGQMDAPSGNDFIAVSAWNEHALALRSDGSIVAWGKNQNGECNVPEGNDFIAISAGHQHSLALRANHTVVGWGSSSSGGSSPEGTFTAVEAGSSNSFAVRTNGSIAVWGTGGVNNPPAGNDYIDIAAGDFFAIALRDSDSTPEPLTADFTAGSAWGYLPLTVHFVDHSTGQPFATSWAWDFDNDGTVDSTSQCPEFTYTQPGNYSVNLTVWNNETSSTVTKQAYITVVSHPTVTASPAGGTYSDPQHVTITANDPFSSTSTIYYTLDGTDPATSDTRIPYTGPVEIDATATLRYAAINTEEYWSVTGVRNYVIAGSLHLADTDMPKFQYDNNNTGRSPFTGPQTANLVWNYTLGKGIYGSPVIGSDGTIYVGSWDNSIYAFYPDGTLKWSYLTGSAVWSTPALDTDGTIYIGSNDKYLYALNPNGTLKWKYGTENAVYSSAPAIGADGTIVFGEYGHNVYCLYPNGTLKWKFSDIIMTYSSPAIGSDGTVYIGAEDNSRSTDTNVYAINPDGTLKWKYETGASVRSAPSIGPDGTIYVGNGRGTVYALNPDGTLRWQYETGVWIDHSSVAIAEDGTLYVGNGGGDFFAINPDGSLKWTYDAVGSVMSSPMIGADGTIYFGSSNNKINALSPEGTLKWSYDTGDSVFSSATITSDGTLYIGSRDWNLYAFRDPSTALTASFTANVTEGFVPLTVQFNDTSFGTPASWAWDFENDGVVDSTEQNPVHTYAAAGTYSVNLTVADADGSDTGIKADYISANLFQPKTVTVGATGCDFADLDAAFASPSLNDGDTIRVFNGSYILSTPTTKTVALLGEGAGVVTVSPTGATFLGPGTVIDGIAFTGGSISISGADSTVTNCTFTGFSNPQSISISGQNSVMEGNVFANNPNRFLMVAGSGHILANNTFEANGGLSNAAIRFSGCSGVTITGNTFANNTVPAIGLQCTLADNRIYLNNFIGNNGDVYQFPNSPAPLPVAWNTSSTEYTYQGTQYTGPLGNYYSSYTGEDADGDGVIDTARSLVSNQTDNAPLVDRWQTYFTGSEPTPVAPTAAFTADVTSGDAPLAVVFTDASTGDPASWAWDFENDGTVDSNERNATFTYASAGTYTVNLTVANDGGSNSVVKTDYITVTEPAGSSVLPDYNNIFVKVANDHGAKYNAFGNSTYNIRFEGIGRGLNALHISTDPAVNFGQATVSENQTGTFYATDSGGKGYEDEIILMVAVNGTIPDDFRLRITADGYTWTPNPASNQPPSLDNVTYQAGSLDEVFTKEDFIYGPQIWKPTGNEADYPIYAGQNMTDTENTFQIMFIDLNAGVLRPNEALENRGAVRINYAFENLESFAAFSVYGYCKISNNGNEMVAWTNALTSDKAMSGYSVTGVPYTPPSAPVADFTATPLSGEAPLAVAFTDASTGTPASWAWDFENDGLVDSTEQNPAHVYDTAGTYTVNLTVVNAAGSNTTVKTDYITVSSGGSGGDAPVANFTANMTSGDTPLAVAFTDLSTNTPTSWAWDFENDGVVDSTEQNPSFTYTAAGTYTVNLTVENDIGSDSAVKTGYIVVTEPYVPQPASIVVTPSTAELLVGATQAFAATVYDTDGGVMDDVTVAWTSSNGTVGTLNAAGLFTAVAPGTTIVTAAYANVAGTAVVTVTQPQGDQTQDTPLDIPGCNVTTGNDGKPQVSINTTATNATINGNTIRIDEGNFTLTIETEGAPTNESGIVNGTIANITLDTQPVTTELGSVGTVSASVSANLNGIPQGAGLTTTVSQNVSADAQSAFQLAATADGLALGDVAYTLNIVRTNLENGQDIAGATIRMAVSPAWVAAHGGVDAIRIIRSAEDGTNEVLATTLVGTDADGNMVFEAVSPNGLSIFGLAAATAASQPTGSSSSSGGSSGTSTSVGAASNLKSGESVTLAMDATAVSAVTLTANAEVRDLMMTVAKGSLPQAAEPPAGTVYQYVQATLYKATEADLAAVQLRFAVPSKWLSENDCTAEQVTLFRYADGAWQAVPVEALGEENGNPVFSAAANGFGLFAIAATEEVPGPTGEATGEPTTTETPTGTSGTVAHAEEGQATPQATPFPVWAAILAFGVLLFVRRT